jgi:hypothetical protein
MAKSNFKQGKPREPQKDLDLKGEFHPAMKEPGMATGPAKSTGQGVTYQDTLPFPPAPAPRRPFKVK